jgi:hypothetical protein
MFTADFCYIFLAAWLTFLRLLFSIFSVLPVVRVYSTRMHKRK